MDSGHNNGLHWVNASIYFFNAAAYFGLSESWRWKPARQWNGFDLRGLGPFGAEKVRQGEDGWALLIFVGTYIICLDDIAAVVSNPPNYSHKQSSSANPSKWSRVKGTSPCELSCIYSVGPPWHLLYKSFIHALLLSAQEGVDGVDLNSELLALCVAFWHSLWAIHIIQWGNQRMVKG